MLPEVIVRHLNQLVTRIPAGRTLYVMTERETYALVEACLSHFGAVVLHYQCGGRHGMFIVPHWYFFHQLDDIEVGKPFIVRSQCGTDCALWLNRDESPVVLSAVRNRLTETRRLRQADRYMVAHPISQIWSQLTREQLCSLAWTYSTEDVASLAGVSEREVQARYSRARIDPPGRCYWRRVELAYIAHPMGVPQPRQSTNAIKRMRAPESSWVLHA
jgi:hypothetical protein